MPDETTTEGGHAFWSGTITFGLVTVPVNLFPANRPGAVRFRMLDEDGTPLRRKFLCPKEDRLLESNEMVRGYEVAEDQYVIITDEELEALEPRKTRDIDLRMFVDEDEIDPLYFSKSYFLTPDGESNKAYRLLAEVMEKERKAGVATFVMREREYVVAIFSANGILRAETLRFSEEVRGLQDLGLPRRKPVVSGRVAEIAEQIAQFKAPKLKLSFLHDKYADEVSRLVEQKRKEHQDVVTVKGDAPEEAPETDLMVLLKRSLGGSQAEPGGPRLVKSAGGKASRKSKRPAARRGAPGRSNGKRRSSAR